MGKAFFWVSFEKKFLSEVFFWGSFYRFFLCCILFCFGFFGAVRVIFGAHSTF
jgi:hypothetical protein